MVHDRNFVGAVEEERGAATNAIYGQPPPPPPSPNQVAKPVSIAGIRPDPAQPRRAIPSAVLNSWNYGAIDHLLLYWNGYASKERTGEFCNEDDFDWIAARITGEGLDEWEYIEDPGPVERSLLEIADLAASIRRDGLTNPITVIRRGDYYMIETGERRWLAYQLLHFLVDGADQWAKIPARIVESFDVFRQAAENNQRQNLNAISKARQYAILMMALHPDNQYEPYEACESDRAYYAQAFALTAPYGKREQVLNAMGVTSGGQLSTYKKLLLLSDEIWLRGDDENWPERKLFSALNSSGGKKSPSPSGGKRTPKHDFKPLAKEEDVKRLKNLAKLDSRISGYEPDLKAWVRDEVAQARVFLDQIEQFLDSQEE